MRLANLGTISVSLNPMRIALIADFDPAFPPHPATEAAVRHAADAIGVTVEPVWVATPELVPDSAAPLSGFAGVWIAPGSPYQSLYGALGAIRFARERDVPLLGTCGGFQHVVIEYARNVLGIVDAEHEEYLANNAEQTRLFISRLACSLAGRTMEVRLVPGSLAARAYGSRAAEEQYYCNFGINPEVVGALFGSGTPRRAFPTGAHGSAGASPSPASPSRASRSPFASTDLPAALQISGVDQDGEPRVTELTGHRFFVATLYVPQMRSQVGGPHPLVSAWLQAASRTVL